VGFWPSKAAQRSRPAASPSLRSPAGNTGSVTITGAGSALTLTGAATATIGAASASIGTLTVENGGAFTTGTGLTTVNATGDLNINAGGTMIVRGNMTVANSLEIANGGTVILDASAPAPGEFAETDLTGPDEFDFGAVESIGGSAVPEPGSATLITAGALGLLVRRRRR
jgi:T5SS/PEP-CTERM-associated repeat protein